MANQKLFVSSHAPYWHNGSSLSMKSYNIMLAVLPAVLMGIYQYGPPALGVVALSVSTAMIWELIMNYVTKRPASIGDGNAAVIGLLMAMLLPASTPWWTVLIGTFLAVVVGKQIFGGIGCNPLNPVLVAIAIILLSWKGLLDFDEALVNYDLGFEVIVYPLAALKHLGTSVVLNYSVGDLLMGQYAGAIGSTFGIGLIIGGIYLILRGMICWEISISFLAGVFVTAFFFNIADSEKYAGPLFHLLTGYTLIGAFFLATEDSSSPVNFIPMLIYGACAGFLTVLIRNIGAFVDGAVFAILMMNIANPLLDKIRPKPLGKGIKHA
ncbi:MAG: RnfABCDGE type electron transport complex subunit D [Desulfobacteraceae bacterium]|uniref:RnfABCDGE type electron transport complex subunit D n=1 Tax=Candidatus Desulfacyla euxinica TaxID=2841693 RepID=A0A8J6T789_9DELT|nr:RnfABCDGE type electron transport complex subunit D [Candidatus Desulfacyla euxinica]MBL6977838.1 RnfABCDGE type electron transport complex subunit D [Desulfobacteraceae bacterium]